MNDSLSVHAIHGLFIYDWHDGPTEGMAKSHAGTTVWFLVVKTFQADRKAFLLTSIASKHYDALRERYGPPPDNPFEGLLIEHDDRSADILSLLQEKDLASEGIIVLCRDDLELTFLQEFPVTGSVIKQLSKVAYSERVVDYVINNAF